MKIFVCNTFKFLLIIVSYFVTASCSKITAENVSIDGNTTIVINPPKIDTQVELDLHGSTKGVGSLQEQRIDLEGGDYIIATLAPQGIGSMNIKEKFANANSNVQNQIVANKTRYSLYVYSIEGNYIAHRDYAVGEEGKPLEISGGRRYIFVAYSVNSKESLPAVENPQKLSTAELINISEDLMYYKDTVNIIASQTNVLQIIFKHQFSSVTTTVKMTNKDGTNLANNDVRNLTNVNDLIFSNLSNSASLKFVDNSLSFASLATGNTKRGVFDKTPGVYEKVEKEKSTSPTLLIAPAGTNTTLTIPAITSTESSPINGLVYDEHTKGNIVINNIKLAPGYKYNLILQLYKPLTEAVVPAPLGDTPKPTNHYFSKASARTDTYYRYESDANLDYGLTIDLHTIDNSFNMIINNRPIAVLQTATSEIVYNNTSTVPDYEIEMQSTYGIADKSNIMFYDGDMYEHYLSGGKRVAGYANEGVIEGSLALKSVFSIIGTREKPTMRVVISPSGNVSIFGIKKLGGPLEPMVLRSDSGFPENYKKIKTQKVVWNKSGKNTFAITQKDFYGTYISGTIRGYKTK